MAGAALTEFKCHIMDWSEHNGNYALRSIPSPNSPRGWVMFMGKSEFERIKHNQTLIWKSSHKIVQKLLDNL